jgi:TRAP-type C4-dicarboxylate transport system substrate-binding protein
MKKIGIVFSFVVIALALGLSIYSDLGKKTGGLGKIAVVLAGTEGDTTPQSRALHEVAKRLNASGRFDVKVFTSGSLSSDTDDLVTQAQAGIPIVIPSDPGRIASQLGYPDLGVLMAPYVLKDYRVLNKLITTDLYKEWDRDIEARGVKLVTNNWYNGMRHFVTNVEIKSLSDLKGQRIRGFGNNIGLGLAKYLGYTQTSVPATDIYQLCQQKGLDGCEIQTPASYGYRLYEVLKYTTLTSHYMLTSTIVCGAPFFNSMAESDQALFLKTFQDVGAEYQEIVAGLEKSQQTDMAGKGMIINSIDIAPFEAAVQPLYGELGFSAGLKDRLFRELGI